MPIGHLEIEGHDWGEVEAPIAEVHGTRCYPFSRVYVCAHCGRAFARLTFAGQSFIPWTVACERCPPPFSGVIPGSIELPWERPFDSMPAGLLQREALLHIAHWERENGISDLRSVAE